MNDTVVDALIQDLLRYIDERERTYEEVLEAWRTSCPRLPVWEEAVDRGLLVTDRRIVRVTAAGRALLGQSGANGAR